MIPKMIARVQDCIIKLYLFSIYFYAQQAYVTGMVIENLTKRKVSALDVGLRLAPVELQCPPRPTD
jgi:hypothetical protein